MFNNLQLSSWGLARNNMEQSLDKTEDFDLNGCVSPSFCGLRFFSVSSEIRVWLLFSECSLGFQLPVALQRPVVAWTLETLSLVFFQLDKVFTSLILEHVSTEYPSY